ncbi:4-coumarate--CoA ligase-like 7 [Cladophialophora carrionii]|uniref:4-coumarate--CoA ligase-like 7 n=1 Tax=Cladophialophora carrionii TaxID=86049 RepID=A0A1C1D2R0_9EURO|nr:4-coumarate--CoA ligase-like 7 [Cladophialophora carrionii]
MVFKPMSWVPQLPEVPDTVPICEFMLDEKHGRLPFSESKAAYTCGLTGKSISASQQKKDVDSLSRALAKEFGWKVNAGTEYDKVAGVFALNTIDIMTLNWAIHRLNGVSSPANAAYNADELRHQLTNSGAQVLFTVMPLLQTALAAAAKSNIPRHRVYICEMANDPPIPPEFKTLTQLIKEGESLPDLEPIKWEKGQGARQTAFLCYSSGTSGLPKGVMISHRNVIANTLQISLYDKQSREANGPGYREVALGLLPQSHIYALIVICHASTYQGDQVIILPRFDLNNYLSAIQNYKINTLYIVPPIIIAMVKNRDLTKKYDLSSVTSIFTGAAPLGKETAEELASQFPTWKIRQGYGLTETCTVVCSSSPRDIWFGSSGCLIPGFEAKVMSIEGNEITGYNQPGELLVKSPSIVLGYLKNEKATQETFVDMPEGRFMRTGDEVEFRVSPNGNEHIWVVDRIKELIKVKGLQVAPAELEACLLNHPSVADCAVIPVQDDRAGEVPKAFVVKSKSVGLEENDALIKRDIIKYVEKEKARHKWLAGGVEFIDVIPKSPSGKILRRLLRDKEREARRKASAKL